MDVFKLYRKMDDDGVNKVEFKLSKGYYSENKISLIKGWLASKGGASEREMRLKTKKKTEAKNKEKNNE